jgi:molybdopterin converting factor small subunit
LYNAMQAIIGQELRARYETPQEVPPEMLQLLAHLDEQAGKESQDLNKKQEPELTLSTLIRRLSTKGELHDKTGVQFLDGKVALSHSLLDHARHPSAPRNR